jgi:hypothetical protein
MAKKSKPQKKAAKKKSAGKKKFTLSIKKAALVATVSANSQPANINCVFSGGIGQVTAALFRRGAMINMQSISSTGVINFSEVQSGDVITLNGVCTGRLDATISVPTTPGTPKRFTKIITSLFRIN